MQLDPFTLVAVATVNLLCISAALPLIMGRRVQGAARTTQLFLLQLTVGWALLTASSYLREPVALYVVLSVL